MTMNSVLFLYTIIILATVRSTTQKQYPCDPTAVCGCSSKIASTSRIVGGEDAGLATWGWTVSLEIAGGRLCSGSILSDSWIITAAHCVADLIGHSIIVHAGSNIRWSGTQTRMVSQTIVHAKFDPDTFENDISLLRLDSPLNMSRSNLSKICLPLVRSVNLTSEEWPPVNTSVVTVGWGRLFDGGPAPDVLQQVTLQTVAYNASTCRVLIANKKLQFCAGVPGGAKDACQGDSGGPLMMFTSSGRWVLVGLISSGRGCALPAFSGIYTRVVVYKDWINSFTNSSHWIDVDSHANTISTSPMHLFLFAAFIFLIGLYR